MSVVQIFLANARLDDPAAMEQLLAPLADGGALASSLENGVARCTYAYDRRANIARYIVSDGELASCFSLTGISAAEGAAISKACEDKSDWSLQSFRATVSRVLGGSSAAMN